MFKRGSQSAGYTWPVEVVVPEDGGKVSKHIFEAHFKRFTQTQADALTDRIGESDDEGRTFKMVDLAVALMDGWGKVTDQDGNEIAFSEAELRATCDQTPQVPGAIFNAWIESLSKGREKNSGRPRATG